MTIGGGVLEEWRYVTRDIDMVDTAAIPPAVIQAVSKGSAPSTVAVVGFTVPGISIGYFQDIDTEVDYEKAKGLGIQVIRRYGVGGGTIFVDPKGSMAMFMVFNKDFFKDMDEAFVKVGEAIADFYKKVGVEGAWYKHIGDVKVGDRKITGFGFVTVGNLMVQNTIIGVGDINVKLFMQAAKIPPEKFQDKKAKDVAEWVTNIQKETGRLPSKEEVQKAMKEALEEHLNITLTPGELTEEEENIRQSFRKMVLSEEHTFAFSSARRFPTVPSGYKFGWARYKARKLLVAHAMIDREGRISDVMFSGDFYCSPAQYLKDIEENLKGVEATDREVILGKVKEIYSRPDWQIPMVDAEDFVEALGRAVENALEK